MIRADARHIVAMFIRKATRKYKGRVYTNYQLVRSVQTPKGPRQKMICSLGDLSPRPAEAWRQLAHQVEDALHGQPDLFEGSREPEVEQRGFPWRTRSSPATSRTERPWASCWIE